MTELKPRKGGFVTLVFQVVEEAGDDGVTYVQPVSRTVELVRSDLLPMRLDDDYASVVGHPMEALGGFPGPERYTAEGVNRPPVVFAYAPVPGVASQLTDETIEDLADKARTMVVKRLKDQAAMEDQARQG